MEKENKTQVCIEASCTKQSVVASKVEEVIERLRRVLPPVFTRSEIERLTGGVIKKSSIANIEAAEGKIPGGFYMRRRRAYQLEPFLEWWAKQITFDN